MKSILHVLPSFKKSNRTKEKNGIGKKISFSEDLYGFMKLFQVVDVSMTLCMCVCVCLFICMCYTSMISI